MNTGEYTQKQSEKLEISLAKVLERKKKAAFRRLFSFRFVSAAKSAVVRFDFL